MNGRQGGDDRDNPRCRSIHHRAASWRRQNEAVQAVLFSQGWHLAWTGKPFFADEFEGWRHGPVSQQLRHHTEAVAKGDTEP
ncbi:DUF4065 domain-containing protein [Corynebacterium pseudodiphtheriticum]|nr:DUF4065 domain-containing protein [Corynebacterium pseudodiphtheriticum]